MKPEHQSKQQMKFFSIESENLEDLLSKIGLKESCDVTNRLEDSDDTTIEREIDLDDENQKIQEAEEIIALQAKKTESHLREETETTKISLEIIEEVLDDIVRNFESRKEDEPKTPFGFSDFASQPNRPYSPNLSDNEEKLESKPDEEVQKNQEGVEDSAESPSKSKQIINYSLIMEEYASRKSHHTLPQKTARKNPFIKKQQTSLSRQSVDPEIERQRTASLMKDSEARSTLYTELVCLVLNLLADLNDEEFKV